MESMAAKHFSKEREREREGGGGGCMWWASYFLMTACQTEKPRRAQIDSTCCPQREKTHTDL